MVQPSDEMTNECVTLKMNRIRIFNILSKCDVLSYLRFLQILGICCIDLPDI